MTNSTSPLRTAWDAATDAERAELVAMIFDLAPESPVFGKVRVNAGFIAPDVSEVFALGFSADTAFNQDCDAVTSGRLQKSPQEGR